MNFQQRGEATQVSSLFPQEKRRAAPVEQYELLRLEAIKQDAEKRAQERVQALLKEVPRVFKGKSFADFKVDYPMQEGIKRVAQRYVETFAERLEAGNNLIFLGNPGTGKTFLSLVLYQKLAEAGYEVGYKPSLHFLRIFREKNFESHTAFDSLLTSYKRIQFLIIDEVTESQVTGDYLASWEKEMLFSLINARYQEGKLCTLIISNRSKEGLIDRLGERVVSRLSQNGITLAFDWNSYR